MCETLLLIHTLSKKQLFNKDNTNFLFFSLQGQIPIVTIICQLTAKTIKLQRKIKIEGFVNSKIYKETIKKILPVRQTNGI